MVQWSTQRNNYLRNNDEIYEVQMTVPGPTGFVRRGNLTTGTDAFGRTRVSDTYTLFDSSFRSGGRIVQEGIFRGQSTVDPIILSDIFNGALQLSRGIIDSDSAGDTFTLTVTPTTNNDDVVASMSWQEKTA